MEKQSCLKKTKAYLRSVDALGVPVQLTMNRNGVYKTSCGGLVSCSINCLVLLYIILQITFLFTNPSYDLNIGATVL